MGVEVINSVGHKGKYGHEFMEFEFKSDGTLRYANNSNYKNDVMIRKEGIFRISVLCVVKLSPAVMNEVRRIVEKSEIMQEDDANWPEPTTEGRQELEIILDNKHIFFIVAPLWTRHP